MAHRRLPVVFLTIRTLNNRIVLQVSHAIREASQGRVVFRCHPFDGINHAMLAAHDRWLVSDESKVSMYRLRTIDFDYTHAKRVQWVHLYCSEIVLPSKEIFEGMGLGFLDKKSLPKCREKSLKKLILDDEI